MKNKFTMYALTIILVLIITFTSVQNLQIHEHLTKEQVRSIFKIVDGPVPDHDVVPIDHTFIRDYNSQKNHKLQLEAFGKKLQLYLNPSDGILAGQNMKIWTAKYDNSRPYNVTYKQLKKIRRTQIFEDVNKMAVISVTMDRFGKPMMDGIIGDDLRISPLPHDIIKDMKGQRIHPLTKKLLEMENFIHDYQTYHHVIYKINQPTNSQHKTPKKGLGYEIFQKHQKKVRSKREIRSEKISNETNEVQGFAIDPPIPGTAYPEIIVIIDYDHYLSIGPDYSEVVKYVLSYFQAVDLRFRRFGNPKIRLNIKGIIISSDRDALAYIRNNALGNNLVDIDSAIEMKAEYFQQEKSFILEKDYDILITLTGLDLCNKEAYGFCNPSLIGYSYNSGACVEVVLPDKRIIESLTLVEDNGGFSGVIPTAHEIGHLMGSQHDGPECDGGYIMNGRYDMSPNNFKWSSCSFNLINEYLRSPRAECLYNKPSEIKKYPRLLPGKHFSLEDQCRRAFNTTPCHFDDRVCTRLECYVPGTDQCEAKSSAAEGSTCGIKKICINGRCVPDVDKKYFY